MTIDTYPLGVATPMVLAFAKRLETDMQLRGRLDGISTIDDVVRVASEAGFAVTQNDLKAAYRQFSEGELDDDELDAVSGGAVTSAGASVPSIFTSIVAKILP